jgi:hypothetical protein
MVERRDVEFEVERGDRLRGWLFKCHEVVPVDIGHTDTDHTTCLYVR